MEAHCLVSATCADCDHASRLDLSELATRGHGDVALIRLPLKCQCGSRRVGISVSGKAYGGD
jgi:hypothetical protein